MQTKQCPVPGCTAPIPVNMALCQTHWSATPMPIRREIGLAWQGYLRHSGHAANACKDRMEGYLSDAMRVLTRGQAI